MTETTPAHRKNQTPYSGFQPLSVEQTAKKRKGKKKGRKRTTTGDERRKKRIYTHIHKISNDDDGGEEVEERRRRVEKTTTATTATTTTTTKNDDHNTHTERESYSYSAALSSAFEALSLFFSFPKEIHRHQPPISPSLSPRILSSFLHHTLSSLQQSIYLFHRAIPSTYSLVSSSLLFASSAFSFSSRLRRLPLDSSRSAVLFCRRLPLPWRGSTQQPTTLLTLRFPGLTPIIYFFYIF